MVYIGVPSQLSCFLSIEAAECSAVFWAAADGTRERSVKDAAESIGIPHVEIGSYRLLIPGDGRLKIIPEHYSVHSGDYVMLTPSQLVPEGICRFVLDVHLGKLARYLRLLGLDCWYRRDYTDAEIAELAGDTNRTVLTRDIGLLKRKPIKFGYWLRSQIPFEQAEEVVRRYRLQKDDLAPLSRCPHCNSPLAAVPKNFVFDRLPEKTRTYYEHFFQCLGCGQIYWRGSHYPKLLSLIEHVTQ